MTIRCIKGDGRDEPKDSGNRIFKALDAPVGNGNAVAKSRRAQPFSGKQGIKDLAAGNPLTFLKEQASLLKDPLFARGVHPQLNVVDAEQIADFIHTAKV